MIKKKLKNIDMIPAKAIAWIKIIGWLLVTTIIAIPMGYRSATHLLAMAELYNIIYLGIYLVCICGLRIELLDFLLFRFPQRKTEIRIIVLVFIMLYPSIIAYPLTALIKYLFKWSLD